MQTKCTRCWPLLETKAPFLLVKEEVTEKINVSVCTGADDTTAAKSNERVLPAERREVLA